MNVVEFINKLRNILNELINSDLVKTIELLNELLETLKITEDCTDCNNNAGRCDLDQLYMLISEIEGYLVESEGERQEKEDITDELNKALFKIDNKLNKEMLCEGCKEK